MNIDCLVSQDPEGARPARRWSLGHARWILWLVAGALTSAPAPGQPANDNLGSAGEIAGSAGSVTGNNVGATVEADEPDHAEASSGASVWWRWTAPASGRVAFSTIGSHFDTVIAVYKGETMESLVLVGENDDDDTDEGTIILGTVTGYHSRVAFVAEMGTTYRVAVDGSGGNPGDHPPRGAVLLTWYTRHLSDDLVDATEIVGTEGVALGSTSAATSEPGEPVHLDMSAGGSVWWRWDAPATGPVTFSLISGGLIGDDDVDSPPLLAVYEGQTFDDLAFVTGNFDPASLLMGNAAAFEAIEGTTYWVALDVAFERGEWEDGDITLRWKQGPDNDVFRDAFEIAGASVYAISGDNAFATIEPFAFEPERGDTSDGASVWWKWTALVSGPVTFDTFGSSFDTVLAVYVGEEVVMDGSPFPVLELTEIALNDDDGAGLQSRVTFVAVAGTTYKIAVDNVDERERGDIVLNWRPAGGLSEPLRIEDVSRLPDGSFHFVLRGPPGITGTIYRSRALDRWEPWMPFLLTDGTIEITDPDARMEPNFFYKASVQW